MKRRNLHSKEFLDGIHGKVKNFFFFNEFSNYICSCYRVQSLDFLHRGVG